ncbi:hypothetical protein P1P68_24590 [Streptomyces scabiei]|nr:hypothetical protein [Streptomyces scabiei]MDW8807874.1 hypothetical protein [Streptomyces scabiei]
MEEAGGAAVGEQGDGHPLRRRDAEEDVLTGRGAVVPGGQSIATPLAAST